MLLVSLSTPHLPLDWCVSQPWLTGHRMFGVSNRDTRRCNILQSGCEITGHTQSTCPYVPPPLHGPLGTGVYSVEVYDIE